MALSPWLPKDVGREIGVAWSQNVFMDQQAMDRKDALVWLLAMGGGGGGEARSLWHMMHI